MTPHCIQGAQHTAHHTAQRVSRHISSANSTQLGSQVHRTSTRRDGDRARQTQRKRDRQEGFKEMKVSHRPSPATHFTSHVMHGRDGEVHGSTHNCDNGFGGDGGPAQQLPQHGGQQGQAEFLDTDDVSDKIGMNVDDLADLFGPEPSPPRPPRQPIDTKRVQYVSSHHRPFTLDLQPPRPVQPATRREPIRMVNCGTPHMPDIDDPTSSSVVQPPSRPLAKIPEAKKHPVNMYKGSDPVKRRVQNQKLQRILLDKPLSKPRKRPDRMVLKCAGRREFR